MRPQSGLVERLCSIQPRKTNPMIDPNTGLEGYYVTDGHDCEFIPYPTLTYYIDPDTGRQVIRGADMEEARFDRICLTYDLIPQTSVMKV
ncbi:hypothetical protein [uncultured Kiloniella sp.]|uniref:hypothetical protein n=2 Tax=Pseudomonadota TaxID=1224 RepID=UPI002618261A|nr:hypothetical protein [uncultured Kiloniella sp.]